MSGSGGGSGYNFQADAFAYVASLILSGKPLDWLPSADDVPVAVALETGSPGDDLQIDTVTGIHIEVQARFHAKLNVKLIKSLVRLIGGLIGDSALRGVLLVDSASSNNVRSHLRTDIKRLGQGRRDNLSDAGQTLLKALDACDLKPSANVFNRLAVIVLDLDPGSAGEHMALDALRSLLADPNRARDAWQRLGKRGLEETGHSGADDLSSLIMFLEPTITVGRRNDSAAAVFLQYREWIRSCFGTFRVVGFPSVLLPASVAWDEMVEIEINGVVPGSLNDELSRYHNPKRDTSADRELHAEDLILIREDCVIVGPAGVGKSTLVHRLIVEALDEGLVAIRVPLKMTASRIAKGETLEEAILHTAFEGSPLALDARAMIAPTLLIADGLDECGTQRSDVAARLLTWRHGHRQARLIVTTRSFGYAAADFPRFIHSEVEQLSPRAVSDLAEKIFAARIADHNAATLKAAEFDAELDNNRAAALAARTPLLLGCLAALFTEGRRLPARRAALLDSVVQLLRDQPLNRPGVEAANTAVADRAMEIAGWNLIDEPILTKPELRDRIGAQLVDDGLAASRWAGCALADSALAFWEDRRLMERLTTGASEIYTFVHRTLGEFAAARYANGLAPEQREEWLLRVYGDPQWREPILLAAGLGLAEWMTTLLLKCTCRNEEPQAALLAADTLAESTPISLDLSNTVVAALQPLLLSDTTRVVIDAAERLIALTRLAPRIASHACKPLLEHHRPLVRLAAEAVVLSDASEEIPTGLAETWLDGFLPIGFLLSKGRLTPRNKALPSTARELQLQTIGTAIDALFRTLPEDQALHAVSQFLSRHRNDLQIYAHVETPMARHGHHDAFCEMTRSAREMFRHSLPSFDTPEYRAELDELLNAVAAVIGEPTPSKEKAEHLRFMSRLLSAFGLFRWYDPLKVCSDEDRELIRFAVERTIVALGLPHESLRRELAAARQIATQLSTRGIYAHIREVRVNPNWRRAAVAKRDQVRAMMLHDSSIISWVGVNLLEYGALGGETLDMLRHGFLHGRHNLLFWLTQIAPEIASPNIAAEMIAERLTTKPNQSCVGILRALVLADVSLMRTPATRVILEPAITPLVTSDVKELAEAASNAITILIGP